MVDRKSGSEQRIDIDERDRRVLTALENPDYDWRTLEGISSETDLPIEQVILIISRMPDLVIQSMVPDKDGRGLYTTRRHYQKRHGGIERLQNIFKAG